MNRTGTVLRMFDIQEMSKVKNIVGKLMVFVLCMAFACGIIPVYAEGYTAELDAETEIFDGPGKTFEFVGLVGKDGVYTIVEERYDDHGNIWGRLKSGAGWIMLEASLWNIVQINEVPYTVRLAADESIFAGPGIFYGYQQDVEEDGVYTIVLEALCDDGFLWGRLKSGVGWVRLSDAPIEKNEEYYETDYTVYLGGWVPIYDVPDYDGGQCVAIVGEDGTYSIAGEKLDYCGNVWGKLKSGAGWVDLDYVRTAGNPTVTAYFADVVDDIDPEWCDYVLEESEHMVRIAFRINDRADNLQFCTLEYEGEAYKVSEDHYWIDWMENGDYFVVGVVFYGDMTTYGLSYEDACGIGHYFALYISGKDGSLVFSEYIP